MNLSYYSTLELSVRYKKLQHASNQKEKEDILQALKNSSIIYYNILNFFGTHDFTSYSKRVSNLITIDETKGFLQPISLKK